VGHIYVMLLLQSEAHSTLTVEVYAIAHSTSSLQQ